MRAVTPSEIDVLRPSKGFIADAKSRLLMRAFPIGLAAARRVLPLPRLGNTIFVTRYDDVREVFLNDAAFAVPYMDNLNVIMCGPPFFLGMQDTEEYRRDTAAMHRVMRLDDIAGRIGPAAERRSEEIVAAAGGQLDVVDGLVRRVTFDVLCDYLGIGDPHGGSMALWATRLFEFQFFYHNDDPDLLAEVQEIAPKLKAYIERRVEERHAADDPGDDVLGRCIVRQRDGDPDFTDEKIRVALTGFVVGGPPQPPMVVPHAMEQLLRRPDQLAAAQQCARVSDDRGLAGYVFEAMRFDPIGPALERVAVADTVIAAGTRRATKVAAGTKLLVAFSSAMMDPRRLPEPERFDPERRPHEYIHFGLGLHQCFGMHINEAILPLMLKPLLRRSGLRRAAGSAGRLKKRGPFAERLVVEYS